MPINHNDQQHSDADAIGSGSGSGTSISSHAHESSSIWDKDLIFDDDGAVTSSAAAAAANVAVLQSPMLRRYPSFVPLRRHATSIAEVAFNMTATIVGGGVLSIPLSCARAGIVPFTLLMAVSAAATDLSLYLLVSCSRRCGSRTFGGVARSAYGSSLELFTTGVVFFIVGCIIIGLMILNKGIWSPIAVVGMAYLYQEEAGEEDGLTTTFQDAIVLHTIPAFILMMPFLLKRDLTSLRHTCYIGFFSIAILCIAMAYRALEKNLRAEPGTFSTNVKWVATNIADVLNALPIILLAFLCSFNIISVSCSLVNPTRDRVKTVIHESVFLSFFLMYVFGLAGYLFAYDDTDGNILLCFDPKDPVIFLGRIGCGITTLFALPMNTLPCREALLSLAAQISEARARRGRATIEEQAADPAQIYRQWPQSEETNEEITNNGW